MKKTTKQEKPAKISYSVYLYFRNVGNSKEKMIHSNEEEEFTDPIPLNARKRAFEFIEQRIRDLNIATRVGIISLASYEEAKRRSFTNYAAYSYTITCKVTDENGNCIYEDPINNDGDENEAILGLTDEYSLYQKYGYETGETMELEDGEIVLDTDPVYIYDRS